MGFTLVAATRTSTSPGPGTGSGYSSNLSTSGPPYWWTTTAFILHLLVPCADNARIKLSRAKREFVEISLYFCHYVSVGRLSDQWVLTSALGVHGSQRLWRQPLFYSFEDECSGRAMTFPRG